MLKVHVRSLRRELKDRPARDLPFGGEHLGELVSLITDGTLSGAAAKEVFSEMLASGARPKDVVAEKGLEQLTDAGDVEPLIARVLAAHADKVVEYRDGKTALFGFFVGQVMRESRGKANPQLVQQLLRDRLSSEP